MSLSEAEAEARLAALRRQRESLDRAIADLVLYLELGRRLNAGGAETIPSAPVAESVPPESRPGAFAPERPAPPDGEGASVAWASTPAPTPAPMLAPTPAPAPDPGFPSARPRGAPSRPARTPSAPPPVAFAEDPTGARQYGRALIEAACAILGEAGEPLHARDIHDALIARGFAIPGRDPVAALNTRLWKRSGEGGPLHRHGEAVYGLAAG